ncbi:hypothetical protein [Campylobacter sputorum]|uniref:hypothetical protein n=1 Tax=Campylobacter sputorum TaxID=206 RepID=UPI00053BF719|nr:hypothetical protein [Campylobacter sputorum]
MALKKIEPTHLTHAFSDGQEVELFAPTLAQVKSAENSKNDTDRVISLLIDMSRGEMDKDFITSLPMNEMLSLSEKLTQLSTPQTKN